MPTYAVLIDGGLLEAAAPAVKGFVFLSDSPTFTVTLDTAVTRQIELSDALAGPTITLSDAQGNTIDLTDAGTGNVELSDN